MEAYIDVGGGPGCRPVYVLIAWWNELSRPFNFDVKTSKREDFKPCTLIQYSSAFDSGKAVARCTWKTFTTKQKLKRSMPASNNLLLETPISTLRKSIYHILNIQNWNIVFIVVIHSSSSLEIYWKAVNHSTVSARMPRYKNICKTTNPSNPSITSCNWLYFLLHLNIFKILRLIPVRSFFFHRTTHSYIFNRFISFSTSTSMSEITHPTIKGKFLSFAYEMLQLHAFDTSITSWIVYGLHSKHWN